jgi:hypothetical protein
LAEIRDALSAEFEPVSLYDVVQYFKFMETLGIVTLSSVTDRVQN